MIGFTLKRFLYAFMAVAIIVAAACGTVPPNNDWCYSFDFTTTNYSSLITFGQWESGQGFTTGEDGQLAWSYSYTATVEPTAIVITIGRATGVTGDINIEANGTIFGVAPPATINNTLPAAFPSANITINPQSPGTIGSSWSIVARAPSKIAFKSIKVYGNGVNPFPFNECTTGPTGTASPFLLSHTPTTVPSATLTPSLTPSQTATGTLTDTPTSSPSPTPTCEAYADQTFDFTTSDYGATSTNYNGYYVGDGSTGFHTGDTNTFDGATNGRRFQFTITFDQFYDIQTVKSATGSGSVGYTIYLENDSVVLFSDARFGAGNWTNISSNANGVKYLVIEQGSAGANVGTWNTLTFSMRPSCSVTPTPTLTSTVTETYTPSSTTTPAPPTATFTAFPSQTGIPGTRTPIVIATPSATLTPPATQTLVPLPSALPTRTALPGPTHVSSATPDLTATPGGPTTPDDHGGDILNSIGDFFSWTVNAIGSLFDWFASIPPWLSSVVANFSISINNLLSGLIAFIRLILATIQQLISIINLLILIVLHLINLFLGWMDQWINVVRLLIQAYYGAFPTPIPFLPQCTTAPLDSGVCAFYDITQHTLLDGTVGGLIIPILVLIVDVTIIIKFIVIVRNLIGTQKL